MRKQNNQINVSRLAIMAYLLIVIILLLNSCKKEPVNPDPEHNAILTFYSTHSPFVIYYKDKANWHRDTITGNSAVRQIVVKESDFKYSQQIKSMASYPLDSLYVKGEVDGKKAERGFKGLYMQIEIDISLSQAK